MMLESRHRSLSFVLNQRGGTVFITAAFGELMKDLCISAGPHKFLSALRTEPVS